jgi:hypothetical protein
VCRAFGEPQMLKASPPPVLPLAACDVAASAASV